MRRCGVLVAAVAAASLWLSAGAAAAERDAATAAAGARAAADLAWGACPDAGVDPRQECASLTVPLDYAAPSGRTIQVAVSRIRAADPAQRRGVLLYNPGGPGESGINGPTFLAAGLPQAVQDRYDLIGFDPRGINYSAPVSCSLAPEDMNRLRFIPYPAHDLDIGQNVAYAQRVAAGCAATSGDVLPYISTANTARDMDRIRAALAEPKISYIGYSYGSYLGAAYTKLFPGRTDRFILDSVVHPQRIWREMFASWGYAVELAFTGFTRYAADHHATYGLGATPAAVYAKTLELIDELEAEPWPYPDSDLLVTGDFFRELIRNNGLRDDRAIPALADLFAAIDAREVGAAPSRGARALVRAAARRPAAAAPGSAARAAAFPTPPADNGFAAPWSVVCGDADWPSSPSIYQRDVIAYDRLFPIHGRAAANIWPCAFWAFEPREPAPVIGPLGGTGKVLLVQSVRDPATPYDGAQAMRSALGSRSRLITVENGAHFIAFDGKNACADGFASAYLVTGALPADSFCPRDAPIGAATGARGADGVARHGAGLLAGR